jgi:hypothetical protein
LSRSWAPDALFAALILLLLVPSFMRGSGNGTAFVLAGWSQKLQGGKSASGQQVSLAAAKNGKLGDHYLMLVNTALAPLMTPAKFTQFDQSPYDGVTVAFWHAFDTSKVLTSGEMSAKISGWKRFTKKDIWPWVYVNRILGGDENDRSSDSHYFRVPYFQHIRGADLDDTAGALTDFLQFWRNSLRAARDSHGPGIVLDLEFYNCHKEYEIGELAARTGKKPQEAVERLRQIGAQMADIAAAEYPGAVLWLFFTGFGYPELTRIDGQPFYGSPAYISMGLLDEIQKKGFRLTVLSGGETTLGYCRDSVQQLEQVIRKRATTFAPMLRKYEQSLELAGTMTLWSDRARKTGWAKDICSTSEAATAEDLQPYLELLLRSYRYNWIYAATDVDYDAFAPQSAPRFDAVIRKAKARASGSLR